MEARWYYSRWGHWVFHLPKPSVPNMALRSKQPLTDASGESPGGKWQPLLSADNFTALIWRFSGNSVSLNLLEHERLAQSCTWTALSSSHPFTEFRKATNSFVPTVCTSLRPHGTTQAPVNGFSWNFVFGHFSKIHSFIHYFVWRQVQNLLQNDSST